MPPLLITTGINPPQGLENTVMKDAARRIITARFGIFYWAAQGMQQIVVADATGSKVLSNEEQDLLKAMGCIVEQISYHQNEAEALQKGKGYAEGQLIFFALKNSRFLQEVTSFYKCTGKVVCRNWKKVESAISQTRFKSVFWSGDWSAGDIAIVDLRLFFCSVSEFFATVYPAYAGVNEDHRCSAEKAVAGAIRGKFQTSKFLRPKLTGFSGTFDAEYPEFDFGDLESRFPCFIEK